MADVEEHRPASPVGYSRSRSTPTSRPPMDIQAFRIAIGDDALRDLHQRLTAVRWPQPLAGTGWSEGTDAEFMQRLVAHWRDRFDWRTHEARLNTLPQFMATVDRRRVSAAAGAGGRDSGGQHPLAFRRCAAASALPRTQSHRLLRHGREGRRTGLVRTRLHHRSAGAQRIFALRGCAARPTGVYGECPDGASTTRFGFAGGPRMTSWRPRHVMAASQIRDRLVIQVSRIDADEWTAARQRGPVGKI